MIFAGQNIDVPIASTEMTAAITGPMWAFNRASQPTSVTIADSSAVPYSLCNGTVIPLFITLNHLNQLSIRRTRRPPPTSGTISPKPGCPPPDFQRLLPGLFHVYHKSFQRFCSNSIQESSIKICRKIPISKHIYL
jgi:hypothetical protein